MWFVMISVLICGQNIDMVQGRPWLLPTPGENKEGNCNVGGVIIKNGDLWTSVNPAQKCFGLACRNGKHSAVYLCKGFPSPPPPPTRKPTTTTTTIIPTTIQTTLSHISLGPLRANRLKSTPTNAPTTTTTPTPTTTPKTTTPTTTLSIAEEGSGFYSKNKHDYYNRKNVIFDG